MNRQGIFYGGLAALGIVILVIAGVFVYKAGQKSAVDAPGEGKPIASGPESATKSEVSLATVVPDANSSAADGVAKPEYVTPTAPGSELSFRSFDVRIEKGRFIPENVVIYSGDVARISFTAVDRAYDVTQPDTGYKIQVKKGETKEFEGKFPNPGKFTAYCDACGGPEAGFLGYIVVVPKQ